MDTLREVVEKVVIKRMRKCKPFTSKDITRKSRKKAPHIYITNQEVSEILRTNVLQWSYSNALEYCVNLIWVLADNRQHVKTYLYHPMDFDPLDYGNDSDGEGFL